MIEQEPGIDSSIPALVMGRLSEAALSRTCSLDHAAEGCESLANDTRRAHAPLPLRPLPLGRLALPPFLQPLPFYVSLA